MVWNVSVLKSKSTVFGYQIKANTIMEAIKEAEEFGTVIRACLAEYDGD